MEARRWSREHGPHNTHNTRPTNTPRTLFDQAGEAAAIKKIKALLWTSGGSFLFESFKWIFQGSDYSE
jgi:hypothetical protein